MRRLPAELGGKTLGNQPAAADSYGVATADTMIAGYFELDGRPYVRCHVRLPRLGVDDQVTVSHSSLIPAQIPPSCTPMTLASWMVHFDALIDPAEFTGVGGTLLHYTEPAVLTFDNTEGGVWRFDVAISIAKPHPITNGLDSLLGRDILNQLDLEYSFRLGRLWLS